MGYPIQDCSDQWGGSSEGYFERLSCGSASMHHHVSVSVHPSKGVLDLNAYLGKSC
ncbi:hypothetical protein GCM10009628_03350 [Paeniglutamicibacter kerguelensis]